MNLDLNLNNINLKAPYTIWQQDGQYFFKTDNLIIYIAMIARHDNPQIMDVLSEFSNDIKMFNDNK